jgi:hypothetical protein
MVTFVSTYFAQQHLIQPALNLNKDFENLCTNKLKLNGSSLSQRVFGRVDFKQIIFRLGDYVFELG